VLVAIAGQGSVVDLQIAAAELAKLGNLLAIDACEVREEQLHVGIDAVIDRAWSHEVMHHVGRGDRGLRRALANHRLEERKFVGRDRACAQARLGIGELAPLAPLGRGVNALMSGGLGAELDRSLRSPNPSTASMKPADQLRRRNSPSVTDGIPGFPEIARSR
jgi:hypothetical protein